LGIQEIENSQDDDNAYYHENRDKKFLKGIWPISGTVVQWRCGNLFTADGTFEKSFIQRIGDITFFEIEMTMRAMDLLVAGGIFRRVWMRHVLVHDKKLPLINVLTIKGNILKMMNADVIH